MYDCLHPPTSNRTDASVRFDVPTVRYVQRMHTPPPTPRHGKGGGGKGRLARGRGDMDIKMSSHSGTSNRTDASVRFDTQLPLLSSGCTHPHPQPPAFRLPPSAGTASSASTTYYKRYFWGKTARLFFFPQRGSIGAFFSISRDLQDPPTFAPLQLQKFN